MEGTPHVVLHTLQLAQFLARQKLHRGAALAFGSAARAPGISPVVQARSLYNAASHLFLTAASEPSEEQCDNDRAHALKLARKCSIIIRNQPSSFDITMQLTALLENIYTASSDHRNAAKTIDDALASVAAAVSEDHAKTLRWWVYFRGRSITNVLASGKSVQQAFDIAAQSAEQCVKSDDRVSAAAFYLTQCQIGLGVLVPRPSLAFNFQQAKDCLHSIRPVSPSPLAMDVGMLNVCCHVLEGFSYIRLGRVVETQNKVIDGLRRCYGELRKEQKAQVAGSWRWLPSKVVSAITLYIMASVRRGNDNPEAVIFAMRGISKLGISVKSISSVSSKQVAFSGISKRASQSLFVTMLENVARTQLSQVDLREAAVLIKAAVNVVFDNAAERVALTNVERGKEADLSVLLSTSLPSTDLTVRSVIFLMLAEFHFLRGTLSGARVATELLQAIQALPNRVRAEVGEVFMSDSWHVAASHLCLLTGDERSPNPLREDHNGANSSHAGNKNGLEATDFVSSHVYAQALFTVGVFYMRKTDVLECRNAFCTALDILKDVSTVNEQVIANTMTVLSGVGMTHENISNEPMAMTTQAILLAQALNDPVTLARATRQHRKLANRLRLSQKERKASETRMRDAAQVLAVKQKDVVGIFSRE